MIYYRLRGHESQNDVQTMVQVFYPNLHYYRTEEISAEETTVESSVEKGIASAMLYRRGEQVSAWSVPYTEPLTEKEKKRLVKLTIFALLSRETGMYPRWGLLTGVRPAKIVNTLLSEGKSDEECLRYLTEKYLVAQRESGIDFESGKSGAETFGRQ